MQIFWFINCRNLAFVTFITKRKENNCLPLFNFFKRRSSSVLSWPLSAFVVLVVLVIFLKRPKIKSVHCFSTRRAVQISRQYHVAPHLLVGMRHDTMYSINIDQRNFLTEHHVTRKQLQHLLKSRFPSSQMD